MLKPFVIFVSLVVSAASVAATMTAVCGPFRGYTIGVSGSSQKHELIDREDAMNATFTVVWEVGANDARVTGSGPMPTEEKAILVMNGQNQISFGVVYPVSFFVYSIYPDRKVMLVTKHTHTSGLDFDGARGFTMLGDCQIEVAGGDQTEVPQF